MSTLIQRTQQKYRAYRTIIWIIISLIGLSYIYSSLPSGPTMKLQPNITIQRNNTFKIRAIKNTFARFWDLYEEEAWGHDETIPVTGGGKNTLAGWGSTIIDNLDTLLLFGMIPQFKRALQHVAWQDFTTTSSAELVDVSNAITHTLSSLLSTIDLMDDLYQESDKKAQQDMLLRQAEMLALSLIPAFDTPHGFPYPCVDVPNKKVFGFKDCLKPIGNSTTETYLSKAGAHYLEFSRLSQLTGKPTYALIAGKAMDRLLDLSQDSLQPGLVSAYLDILSGNETKELKSWGTGSDLYYENLLKIAIQNKDDPRSPRFIEEFEKAFASTKKYLVSFPKWYDHIFLAAITSGQRLEVMSHSACFTAGYFHYASKLLGRNDMKTVARDVMRACRHTYIQMDALIGPELIAWISDEASKTRVNRTLSERNQNFIDFKGFYAPDPRYILRPELIEAFFYSFRLTGLPVYQEWAWEAFHAINAATRTKFGYSALSDVTEKGGKGFLNEQYSSFAAEILKYAYLSFADPDVINLNKYVINTGGHPFKVIR